MLHPGWIAWELDAEAAATGIVHTEVTVVRAAANDAATLCRWRLDEYVPMLICTSKSHKN